MNKDNTPFPESDLVQQSRCIRVQVSLTRKIGLNQAIVVQQLHFLLGIPGGKQINGEHWIFNTYEQWQAEHFPFWSIPTIKRIFSKLESMFIVESCQPDGTMSRKKYYKLNYGMWVKLLKGTLPTLDNPDGINLIPPSDQIDPIEEVNLIRSSTESTVQRILTDSLKKSKDVNCTAIGIDSSDNLARAKQQLLKNLRLPTDGVPTADLFYAFMESKGLENVWNMRSGLYNEWIANKWHLWIVKNLKWERIVNWRSVLIRLDAKIGRACQKYRTYTP